MISTEQLEITEEIEGLGDPNEPTWPEYPIDTVLIRNETRTVHDILRRIVKGTYIMNPDFQRDFVWDEEKQSKLIESVLMRIPLPVFYIAEDKAGKLIVVDGLQRLTTFKRFVNNEFRLQLKDQTHLNNKFFNNLSPKLQNRIEDCNLILYVVDAKVPERARLDIFERVNSGVPLTRQQMRNSLFMGNATNFLKKESQTDLFLDATGRSLNVKTMRDREFVNRYCAFELLPLENYKGDIDDFLASSLIFMNAMDDKDLEVLSLKFRLGLTNNLLLFGKHAFRKHASESQDRNILNASLWDVMSTGLSHYQTEHVVKKSENLRKGFFELMSDKGFMESISSATTSIQKVKMRFSIGYKMLSEALNA